MESLILKHDFYDSFEIFMYDMYLYCTVLA
jgi:hypothetical protein